jgi:hypothetical protein
VVAFVGIAFPIHRWQLAKGRDNTQMEVARILIQRAASHDMMHSVLIVEDDLFRATFVQAIRAEAEFSLAAEADDLQEGIRLLNRISPGGVAGRNLPTQLQRPAISLVDALQVLSDLEDHIATGNNKLTVVPVPGRDSMNSCAFRPAARCFRLRNPRPLLAGTAPTAKPQPLSTTRTTIQESS